MEWNKGFISYCTAVEVRAGKGSPAGGIYYHRGDIPWPDFEKTALGRFPNWKYKAMDLSEMGRWLKEDSGVEVGPAVEYFDGGVVINERFETNVSGLYAAGECALGPFGANRVCSAITEMLVHGAEAGRNAAAYAGEAGPAADPADAFRDLINKAERPLANRSEERPARIRREIQEMAHAGLGPIRNPDELEKLLNHLREVKNNVWPGLARPPGPGPTTRNGWISWSWKTWSCCWRRGPMRAHADGKPRRALPRGSPLYG